MDLYSQVKAATVPEPVTAVGQITALSPLEMRFFGDTGDTLVTAVSTYSPTVGDKSVAVKVGPQWIVLGTYDTSGGVEHPAPTAWQTPQWVSGHTYRILYGGAVVGDNLTADRIYFAPYTHSHGIGRSIDALVMPNSTTETQNARMAIYATNTDGLPGALIESVEQIPSGTYSVFALAADLELQPATTYWIAAHIQEQVQFYTQSSTAYYPAFRFNVGSATVSSAITGATEGRFYYGQTYASGLPNPFPAPSTWTAETATGGRLPVFGVRAA